MDMGELHGADSTLKPKMTTLEIEGKSIDIVYKVYQNQIFIVITEFGKMGNLISVKQETCDVDKSVVFSTASLFGRDDSEIHAAARYIVEQLGLKQQVLIGLVLKDLSLSVLQKITNCIKSLI